ncbi:MAG: ADP-ribosylglycohydrolase family protein, partial [Clostridia bacterium]|nr:ADP-ribosylglycohydrolase family protein [Clostridia bacterium]
ALPFAACEQTPPAVTTTGAPVTTETPEPVFNPDDYNVLSIEDYKDKTMLGFLSQMVGFLSGYEFARSSNGTPLIAMPDSWFEMCNGPYAELNSKNKHTDKHLLNTETGIWEVWNDDDFSIDILNQYILRDMYETYGTFASKVIKDGWVKYNVWDMGGGHRTYGAYGLMKNKFYLPQYTGSSEYGNRYNVNGEPYIANETLGMDAAGMPDLTVKMAEIFGGATSDRDPVLWLKFFSAMYAMAYFEDDIPTLIRSAEQVLPEGCWQRKVIDDMFALKEQYPTDWRRAVVRAEKSSYQEKYDLDSYMGESSINCSMILIGLLWGEGDYYNTCKIISLAGHGGDSTCPVGLGIVGIITGWNGLDETSKTIINEKVWQDGKGVIANLPLGKSSGYYMYCENLPERLNIAELLTMYQENFENILLENGGVIRDGNYYIPKALCTLRGMDTVYVNEFEDKKLDGFTTTGTVAITEETYTGKGGVKISGADAAESAITLTLTGLTKGETYRMSGFVSTAAKTTAELFAKNAGGEVVATAHVYDQNLYVKRQLVFTATDSIMAVGVKVPAGTSVHKYVVLDELQVVRVAETSAGEAKIVSAADADGTYTDKVSIDISANTDKEVYLKITFANLMGKTVHADARISNFGYAGVPFYKTGTEQGGNNTVYIPVIALKNATEYTLLLNFNSDSLYLYDVELVTVTERF